MEKADARALLGAGASDTEIEAACHRTVSSDRGFFASA